jgi:acyl carrier protein
VADYSALIWATGPCSWSVSLSRGCSFCSPDIIVDATVTPHRHLRVATRSAASLAGRWHFPVVFMLAIYLLAAFKPTRLSLRFSLSSIGMKMTSARHSLSGGAHIICKLCATKSILRLLHPADSFSPDKRGAIMQQNIDLIVRKIIAGHFSIEPQRVTDEARFRDDLGADWLDRLEVIIAIEAQLVGFDMSHVVADRIDTVGDLMRAIEEAH